MKSPAPQTPDCSEYCYNFGCQGATNCPARAARIERAIKAGMRKTILKRVAFGLLSLIAVTGVCTLTIIALQASKP